MLSGIQDLPADLLDEIAKGQFDNFRDYLNKNDITCLDLIRKVKNYDLTLIGQALKGTKVTRVVLFSNEISDQSAIDFAETLKYTQVTHVRLASNNIGNKGAKGFAQNLEHSNVTHVSLRDNSIGNKGAKDFAENLKNTNVTHISLRYNRIGEKGTKDFAQNLKNTNVISVNLRRNAIQDTGAKDFIQNLKNTHVIHVNLKDNHISHNGAKDLANYIPDTLLIKVNIDSKLKSYVSDAVQLNIAKYIYSAYNYMVLKLLPEQEKNKFKDIKKKALKTNEGQIKYAAGILINPRLPSDILNLILNFIHPSNKGKASKYLALAKYFHPHGLTMKENPFNVPYQPEIANQYRLYRRKNTPDLESPPAPKQTLRRKNWLL